MIPLKDDNPTRSFPFVNIALLVINILVFFYTATLPPHAGQAFVLANSMIPARIPAFLTGHASFAVAFEPLFTSMFLHSGLMHILGNMLFLWIFGDNVEDYFGHLAYLVFYLVCGIGAGLLHVVFNLNSHLPALGASGAISGVMGSYIILYPRARVMTLFFIILVPIPAFFILGYWFVLQFLEGIGSLGTSASGGVAWWAHIGGFLIGMMLTMLARRR